MYKDLLTLTFLPEFDLDTQLPLIKCLFWIMSILKTKPPKEWDRKFASFFSLCRPPPISRWLFQRSIIYFIKYILEKTGSLVFTCSQRIVRKLLLFLVLSSSIEIVQPNPLLSCLPRGKTCFFWVCSFLCYPKRAIRLLSVEETTMLLKYWKLNLNLTFHMRA